MLWGTLFSQLSAVEAIGVCRQGPGLNSRGERIIRYLRSRRRRVEALPGRRDHRLRDRRHRLGKPQMEIGLLAYFPSGSAAARVSNAERGVGSAGDVQAVRRALVWLESESRREREDARRVEAWVELANQDPPDSAATASLVRWMVDLLHECRCVEFDALVARLPAGVGDMAGNLYLDESAPAPGIGRLAKSA